MIVEAARDLPPMYAIGPFGIGNYAEMLATVHEAARWAEPQLLCLPPSPRYV